MIRLEKLHVKEFRGIRSLDLDLNSETFVIYGPNGSGKSGVVDAIEFALTGDIARLKGEGTGGITITKHGPHVNQRENPSAAFVALTVKDPTSGKSTTITRSVQNHGICTLEPDNAETRQLLSEAQGHPELTLSRRELLKYVVATPGDRAAQMRALLRLGRIEAVRQTLYKAITAAKNAESNACSDMSAGERSFAEHLGLETSTQQEVLHEINKRRKTLGLTVLLELSVDTDLFDLPVTESPSTVFDLVTGRNDVNALILRLDESNETENFNALAKHLQDYHENLSLTEAIRHRDLLDAGLAAVESASCPLCDSAWDSQQALETHIKEKISETDAAQSLRKLITPAASNYRASIRDLREKVDRIAEAARRFGDEDLPHLIKPWVDSLSRLEGVLESFATVTAKDASISKTGNLVPTGIKAKLEKLLASLNAAPDHSETEAAKAFLGVAKDRWARVRLARATLKKTEMVKKTAETIYNQFCEASDTKLQSLYETVEENFSSYYQFVNSDDENTFRAKFHSKTGSLDLAVDFYQQGMFSPVAYHSEGHQDGMGICLYLALAHQLLDRNFSYAILDDVVMSVDANHRRRLAELLKTKFAGVQFVITTHDALWARQMRAVGLVSSSAMAHFTDWSVDTGPIYRNNDFMVEAEAALACEDVPGAAAKLRRALEVHAADIAECIGGSVPYRSDASYELSAFLDAVKSRHRNLLNLADKSATSWENQEQTDLVAKLKQQRTPSVSDQDAEAWLVNKLVHNNDWANATAADFRPTLEAAKSFLKLFQCDNAKCDSWIAVTGKRGSEEELSCACKRYLLNLSKKKSATVAA